MSLSRELDNLQQAVWKGSLPLQIRLAPADCRTYDRADPYLIQCPRLSYLPLLLPRLRHFFAGFLIDSSASVANAWFSFEGVPLKWHYPVGLLYDLFSGAVPALSPKHSLVSSARNHADQHQSPSSSLPWKLQLNFSQFPDSQLVKLDDEGKVLHDAWINSIKEADFLRNGTAKAIMTLSKEDSTKLWESLRSSDFASWSTVHSKLLPPSASLRHIPIRFYLPTSTPSREAATQKNEHTEPEREDSNASAGQIKVVQVLVHATHPVTRTMQTIGAALHDSLPSLFPSRRTPIVARPVLHGAVIPMNTVLEEAMRCITFADGWLHVGIDLMS